MTERPVCLTYDSGDRICGMQSFDADGVTMHFRLARVEVARPMATLTPDDVAAMMALIDRRVVVAFTVGNPPKVVC